MVIAKREALWQSVPPEAGRKIKTHSFKGPLFKGAGICVSKWLGDKSNDYAELK